MKSGFEQLLNKRAPGKPEGGSREPARVCRDTGYVPTKPVTTAGGHALQPAVGAEYLEDIASTYSRTCILPSIASGPGSVMLFKELRIY